MALWAVGRGNKENQVIIRRIMQQVYGRGACIKGYDLPRTGDLTEPAKSLKELLDSHPDGDLSQAELIPVPKWPWGVRIQPGAV